MSDDQTRSSSFSPILIFIIALPLVVAPFLLLGMYYLRSEAVVGPPRGGPFPVSVTTSSAKLRMPAPAPTQVNLGTDVVVEVFAIYEQQAVGKWRGWNALGVEELHIPKEVLDKDEQDNPTTDSELHRVVGVRAWGLQREMRLLLQPAQGRITRSRYRGPGEDGTIESYYHLLVSKDQPALNLSAGVCAAQQFVALEAKPNGEILACDATVFPSPPSEVSGNYTKDGSFKFVLSVQPQFVKNYHFTANAIDNSSMTHPSTAYSTAATGDIKHINFHFSRWEDGMQIPIVAGSIDRVQLHVAKYDRWALFKNLPVILGKTTKPEFISGTEPLPAD